MLHDGVEYYTTEDIADFFEVEHNTVAVWVKRKLIKPDKRVRIGSYNYNLYLKQTVQAFAQKKYGYTP
jgi:hypothetical protein